MPPVKAPHHLLQRRAKRGFAITALTAVSMLAAACRPSATSKDGPLQMNVVVADPEIAAAIDKAKAEVQLKPQSPDAWGGLGSILLAHKFSREALHCFVQAEKLQTGELRWPYLQGVALLSWDPDAALPKLFRAAELVDEKTPAPLLRLAHLLIERGRLDEAEKQLQRVTRVHPEEPQALLGLGKIELGREHLPEALALLERAATDHSTARAATALIATILQRLGNAEAAEAAAQHVSQMPPDAPLSDPYLQAVSADKVGLQAALTRGDELLKSGRVREAIALHQRSVAAHPESATAWRLLGQAQLGQVRYIEGERSLRKAVELEPDSSENHFQLGSALFLQQRFAPAEQCFRRAIELRPAYGPAYFNLATCLTRLNRPDEAIAAFENAIKYDPNMGPAHRQLGATLAMQRRFRKALPSLQRAVALDPDDQAAKQMLKRAEQRLSEGD